MISYEITRIEMRCVDECWSWGRRRVAAVVGRGDTWWPSSGDGGQGGAGASCC